MERVGVRELRQHASRVLARVRNGETIEVTDRGLAVARIVPIGHRPWDELVASGRVTLPSLPGSVLDVEPQHGDPLTPELERLREHER